MRKDLLNKIKKLEGTNQIEDVINFMFNEGFSVTEWHNRKDIPKEEEKKIEKALDKYFNAPNQPVDNNEQQKAVEQTASTTDANEEGKGKEVAVDSGVDGTSAKVITDENTDEQDENKADNNEQGTKMDFTKIDNLKEESANNNKVSKKEKSAVKKVYKTEDNLVSLMEVKENIFKHVRYVTNTGLDEIYTCELTGRDLVDLFLNGTLTYDPQMQRGVKEDKEGIMRAVFRDSHVTEIYNSMIKGEFTPTQIHLGVILDDETTEEPVYDEQTEELTIKGKIRLVDGQHRVRSLVKIHGMVFAGEISEENARLDIYRFNVQIHVTTAQHARTIYGNIDQNLKLDKSQVKHLSNDDYSIIVNKLNQSEESALRDKIATARPVGNRLVLFNTMYDALKKLGKIDSPTQRERLFKHLCNFFDYLVDNMRDAFGGEISNRMEFKKDNLINENIFFYALIDIALTDTENYKKNIDTLIKNVDLFRKDNPIWLDLSVVKKKQAPKKKVKEGEPAPEPQEEKPQGFAINNSNTSIVKLVQQTREIVFGVKKEEQKK